MPEAGERDSLLLDRIQEQLERTRKMLTEGPDDVAEAVLSRMGRRTAFEARLVAQLADRRPLAHPQHFEEAHRLAMHALEVYDRDGFREPHVARLGPLRPLAKAGAELIAKYIVRSHTANASRAIARTYGRREAQAGPGSAERRALARARIQAERVGGGYRGGTTKVPTALVGGAVLPLAAGVSRAAGGLGFLPRAGIAIGGVVLALVFAFGAYVLLQGAATARHRARLLTEQPLAALWETLGRAGTPPRDGATTFAAIAIVLTFVAWFVVPAVAAVLVYAADH